MSTQTVWIWFRLALCAIGQLSGLSQRIICASAAPNSLSSENQLSAKAIKSLLVTHALIGETQCCKLTRSTVLEQRPQKFHIVDFHGHHKYADGQSAHRYKEKGSLPPITWFVVGGKPLKSYETKTFYRKVVFTCSLNLCPFSQSKVHLKGTIAFPFSEHGGVDHPVQLGFFCQCGWHRARWIGCSAHLKSDLVHYWWTWAGKTRKTFC